MSPEGLDKPRCKKYETGMIHGGAKVGMESARTAQFYPRTSSHNPVISGMPLCGETQRCPADPLLGHKYSEEAGAECTPHWSRTSTSPALQETCEGLCLTEAGQVAGVSTRGNGGQCHCVVWILI